MAAAHGLQPALDRYLEEESALADALTYADQTIGPQGQPVTLDERLAESLSRHGPGSPLAQVHDLREPYLRAVAQRVQQRLHSLR